MEPYEYQSCSAAQKRILALVCGYGPSNRYSVPIVMARAYFDESVQGSEFLVIAGYMTSAANWLAFSKEWEELLSIRPPIEALHMAELGERSERPKFHYRIIEKYNLFGIGCAIPIPPLKEIASDLGLPKEFENPYYLAWRVAMGLTFQAMQRFGLKESVEFIFDEKSEMGNIMQAWINYVPTLLPEERELLAGPPQFQDDKKVLPLQAADLFAWWARKQYVKDKAKMGELFPPDWTNGITPQFTFAEMTAESVREQLKRDRETAIWNSI